MRTYQRRSIPRLRRVQVKLNRPGLDLEARSSEQDVSHVIAILELWPGQSVEHGAFSDLGMSVLLCQNPSQGARSAPNAGVGCRAGRRHCSVMVPAWRAFNRWPGLGEGGRNGRSSPSHRARSPRELHVEQGMAAVARFEVRRTTCDASSRQSLVSREIHSVVLT